MENRLQKIERVNRFLVIFAIAIALTFAKAFTSSGGETQTVRAFRFEMVDADGSIQAALGTDADGSTGLFVYDQQNVVRLSLTHDPSQSALFVTDAEGTVRIGIAQFAHGGGGVALHGPQSKGAVVLYHKESGSLAFYDSEGNATERVPAK
ncbi:MAG: hypothetical protein HQ519_13935 [Planctomycetes bacterium]|nr:hypothetical protein [Planctomycetota bacterium]